MSDTSYCTACAELRQKDPNLVANGFTDDNCASLSHDLGLNFKGDISAYDNHNYDTDDPSVRNKDCEDLNMLNDCLIGSLSDEAEIAGMCGWQDYMKSFVPNMWTMFKALICAICGIWDNIWEIWNNIHRIWDEIERLWCAINFLTQGTEFEFDEYSDTSTSYIVAGKGVSFLNVTQSGVSFDIKLTYVAGGLLRWVGSCLFYSSNFTDAAQVYNYDDKGVDPTFTDQRKGNPNWADTDSKPGGNGSELVYEVRILKSEFPQIDQFITGIAMNAEGGGFHGEIVRFGAGEYAYGQHGRCDRNDGDPTGPSNDRGHLVPDGWEYLQLRITWIEKMNADGSQYTPNGFMGVRMNPNEIPC